MDQVSTVGTPRDKITINDLQSDRIRKFRKAFVRQDCRRTQARNNNLFPPNTEKESVVSADGLLNQWGEIFTLRGSLSPLDEISMTEPPPTLGST